jgi:arginine/lysine/ornithine decarboxylase
MLARWFDEPVYFIPIQLQPPRFRLALRHVIPHEQIPNGTDPNVTESFDILYTTSEFENAVASMDCKKRHRDTSTKAVSQETNIPELKRARNDRQGDV